ncbi:hypothetical protein ACFLY2_03295 [Patescibacteria group bacterium]
MSEIPKFTFDNKLTREEILEVKELSKDETKLKEILDDTSNSFKDFIDSEYRWANENYLAKN